MHAASETEAGSARNEYVGLERGTMERISALETEVRRLRDIIDSEIPHLKTLIGHTTRAIERISDRKPELTRQPAFNGG